MSPATAFRVTDAATEAIAERHIRRLTQLLRVPSVRASLHLAGQYETERAQWQQAIDDSRTSHQIGESR